jgi:hypothetical protein
MSMSRLLPEVPAQTRHNEAPRRSRNPNRDNHFVCRVLNAMSRFEQIERSICVAVQAHFAHNAPLAGPRTEAVRRPPCTWNGSGPVKRCQSRGARSEIDKHRRGRGVRGCGHIGPCRLRYACPVLSSGASASGGADSGPHRLGRAWRTRLCFPEPSLHAERLGPPCRRQRPPVVWVRLEPRMVARWRVARLFSHWPCFRVRRPQPFSMARSGELGRCPPGDRPADRGVPLVADG